MPCLPKYESCFNFLWVSLLKAAGILGIVIFMVLRDVAQFSSSH